MLFVPAPCARDGAMSLKKRKKPDTIGMQSGLNLGMIWIYSIVVRICWYRMSVTAIEPRKLRPDGGSFVISLLQHKLREEGYIVENEEGGWELADEDLEAVVEYREDDREFTVRMPEPPA